MRLEGVWLSQQSRKGQPEDDAPNTACLADARACPLLQGAGTWLWSSQGKAETPSHVPVVQKLRTLELLGKIPAGTQAASTFISRRASGNLLQPYANLCIALQLAGECLFLQIVIQCSSSPSKVYWCWIRPWGSRDAPAAYETQDNPFILLLECDLPFGVKMSYEAGL